MSPGLGPHRTWGPINIPPQNRAFTMMRKTTFSNRKGILSAKKAGLSKKFTWEDKGALTPCSPGSVTADCARRRWCVSPNIHRLQLGQPGPPIGGTPAFDPPGEKGSPRPGLNRRPLGYDPGGLKNAFGVIFWHFNGA